MRSEPTILHVDLDAFFAAVEQRDKPSLRGKPVVVGGVGGRGVVATASYEARTFGVHSAMSTAEARRRCPNAAFLSGRFHAYRDTSRAVMALLREISPLVEPLSLDEAFVDLEAADLPDRSVTSVSALGRELKERVHEVTGGLTGSVGIGTSKLIAKIASDLDKPDGLVVVAPGMEQDLLRPMQVTVIPGVGPATAERLRRVGVHTVEELERLTEDELVRLLGRAHGTGLYALARAEDDRSVEPERETKSISVEDTYDTDHVDPRLLDALLERQAVKVTERLRKSHLSGPHGLDQGAAARLLHAEPVGHAVRAVRRRPPDRPGGTHPARRAGHLRRRTPPRGRRLGPRRLDPGGPLRRRGRGRRRWSPTRTPRPPSPPRPVTAAGRPAWTSSTRPTGAAGSGARAAASSRCASRPPRPVPGGCSASR